MREIRTLRAMWRVLETEPRQFLTGHEEGNLGYMPRKSLRATAPVPDPTGVAPRIQPGKGGGITTDFIFADEYRPMKLACSVGDISPTGAKVRNPVAWIARMEETKWVESIDKAILGMVSESQGRNESEPTSSLDKNESGGRAPSSGAKAARHGAR